MQAGSLCYVYTNRNEKRNFSRHNDDDDIWAYEGSNAYVSSDRQLLLPTNLLRYGLTKGIELRLLSQRHQ